MYSIFLDFLTFALRILMRLPFTYIVVDYLKGRCRPYIFKILVSQSFYLLKARTTSVPIEENVIPALEWCKYDKSTQTKL